MTDMTSNEIEIDSFTRPEDIVASVGKKVRVHYHPGRSDSPTTRVGWIIDGGQSGWGIANTRNADVPSWRLFNTDVRPESGLWSGIERVALLEEQVDPTAEFREKIANLEREVEAMREYRRDVAAVINDLIEGEDMDDDLAYRLRDALDIEAPKQEPVTIEWTVTVTATGTPTSRDVAKKLSDGYADSAFIESLLLGTDGLDVDESLLDVDLYNGITVNIEQTEVH